MNNYIGHQNQIYGVEEMRLTGGKGDGMRMLNVRTGGGLEFTLSLDRCADISRLTFKGDNMGYFAPCGYVSPKYYDNKGFGFLKSFTAGFITTCGLTAVGGPCVDEGEELPQHGTISNTPSENHGHWISNDEIHIKAVIRDATLFFHQLILEREYVCPIGKAEITIIDTVKNIGSSETPFELLYHCNMGYPLLSETAEISIPSSEVTARNDHAKGGISDCMKVELPQRGYKEMCFYHKLSDKPEIKISNPSIGKCAIMSYDTAQLPYFTQWKMMGENEYVMGFEPGNCTPAGRNVMRSDGTLKFLQPGEQSTSKLKFEFKEI